MVKQIDTGTGTQANQAIAAAQARLGQPVPNSNWCANFISEVYKSAGLSSVFSATSWVPNLTGQFAGKTSTDITTAKPGDLIVFGNNEHVMLYEGSSTVIGTATDVKTGVSSVIETNWSNVYTDSGAKGPSLVLHTNLDNNWTTPQNPVGGLTTEAATIIVNDIQGKFANSSGDIFTQADLNSYAQAVHTLTPDVVSIATILTMLQPAVGKSYNDSISVAAFRDFLQTPKVGGGGTIGGNQPLPGANILGPLVDVLGKFTNPVNWLHLGAMVIGVGLVGFGLWTVTKDLHETGPQGLVSPMPIMLKEGA